MPRGKNWSKWYHEQTLVDAVEQVSTRRAAAPQARTGVRSGFLGCAKTLPQGIRPLWFSAFCGFSTETGAIGLGVHMPMSLTILGVFGGFIAYGFLGLFIGPTLIAVAFVLLEAWRTPASAGR